MHVRVCVFLCAFVHVCVLLGIGSTSGEPHIGGGYKLGLATSQVVNLIGLLLVCASQKNSS